MEEPSWRAGSRGVDARGLASTVGEDRSGSEGDLSHPERVPGALGPAGWQAGFAAGFTFHTLRVRIAASRGAIAVVLFFPLRRHRRIAGRTCAAWHMLYPVAGSARASALSSALRLKDAQRKTASFQAPTRNEAAIFQIDINAASVLSNLTYTNTNTFDMDTLTLASSEPIAPASVLQVSILLHLWQRERESAVRYPDPSPALAGGRRWTPI